MCLLIVVIQCAGKKRKDAGHLQKRDGKKVVFVADPTIAPVSETCVHARPDDPSDYGGSWRDYLLRYNETPTNNPFALKSAFELYKNEIYRAIARQVGIDKTFILSAGWGLIPGSFLTPHYDITFKAGSDPWTRRRQRDSVADLSMLPADASEPVVFLGGKDYLPLFLRLTAGVLSPRTVFYNSATVPDAPGCSLTRYPTNGRTNWHYQCAAKLLNDKIVT